MPLISPRDDENQTDFIERCMSDDEMESEFPDQDQRLAICHNLYENRDDQEYSIETILENLQKLIND